MTGGYETLTEKEKDTLRLLLGGHDAKSIARQLGLSVHTIHERLRDARRKMGTSSSREAARMLREAERQTPELLGDKPIRAADEEATVQVRPHPARGDGMQRRTGWIVGGLAMMISLALLASLAVVPTVDVPTGQLAAAPQHTPLNAAGPVAATPAGEAAATTAATQFLALLDRDDWSGSWLATHKSFQLLNTADWWAQTSRKVRDDVGMPLSRKLATVDFTAAPPNGYWIIRFSARYSKKGDATETLQLASEGGGWKVAGITIE